MKRLKLLAMCASLSLTVGVAACGDDETTGASGGGNLSGTIAIDGSSTAFPFAQVAAEQFQAENPGVQITVGQSGTSGGFEKFCAGELDIADASRPIDEAEEVPVCKEEGIEYEELQVADDGISVVTNPTIPVECMTTEELRKIWESGSNITTLSDVNPDFPDAELSLFGPGTDSGTFEFFTEAINGEEGSSRTDYQPSEDDNVLVQGVEGDEGGLGYFGFSYYEQNADSLNLVALDDGDGCVAPSTETIQSGEYSPLSRPLFMYPSAEALQRPEVQAFMQFALDNYEEIATNAQIVPMDAKAAEKSTQTLEQASG